MGLGNYKLLDQIPKALQMMETSQCNTAQPYRTEKWEKLKQAIASDYRMNIFQLNVNALRLRLQVWGNLNCLNVLFNNGHSTDWVKDDLSPA
jgi:hypothetical protein